ncbi:MAG TPA: DinB family protein [Anaerolineae bacterium]
MHLLVAQLQFARSEFLRCLEGVTEEDGRRRVESMNSISWTVGHMANQENSYWVRVAQGKDAAPGLRELVGTGRPASTPSLDEMWRAWRVVTAEADPYLQALTPAVMETFFQRDGKPVDENVGTLLMRNIFHYWFHTGQVHAVRELLGHKDLPEFVGDMPAAFYHRED